MSKFVQRAKTSFRTDYNWDRAHRYSIIGAKAAPSAAAGYLLEKVPIVGWLPKYRPRWLVSDVIAGLTLAVMLIPQSLAYAAIADIPVAYGLMASWIPATLYAFMGTSKGESSIADLLIPKLNALRPFNWTYITHWSLDR
jgi:solute carrier family 26 (sodium-independent sulfate anion transporter), member 11